ncbi:prolyl oligopeptidase family serine peptidase [Roseivirga pacifica]|uniref:prolyl oligopeptidase family serine peptidase n=1 Tax=Roseivirga pacifica TaxID=1267423 RepID=UPI00227CB034|nr:prolyl oligopeptidase family serine peptidase [Roseivirga pacifica]
MSKIAFTLLLLSLTSSHLFGQKTYIYPSPPKEDTKNTYFDTTIVDPYQWMENPEDERLKDWLKEQAKITRRNDRGQDKKDLLHSQLSQIYYGIDFEVLIDFEPKQVKDTAKIKFSISNQGADRTPNLVYRMGDQTTYQTLVRVRDFRDKRGDNVVITDWNYNEKEHLIAVEISVNHSDWREVYFYNMITGKAFPHHLENIRTSGNLIWSGRGVYYDSYKKPKEGRELLDKAIGQALYYHDIEKPQSEDELLYLNPDQEGISSFRFNNITNEKLLLYHFGQRGTRKYRAISTANLSRESDFNLKEFIVHPVDPDIRFTESFFKGDTIVMKTTWNAPNGKVIAANINDLNRVIEIVPEYDADLRHVYPLGKDMISCIYRIDGEYMALIYNFNGELLQKLTIPKGKKPVDLYETNPSKKETYFSLSSFYHPNLPYRLNFEDLSVEPLVELKLPYNVESLETRYVKFKSQDGTEIPMYITCLKNVKLNGNNPTLLYGYGGYGITVEPNFDREQALFLAHGGVLAVPNIRGGGAEGYDWAYEGQKLKKQNAINDFIGAAEFLINEGYTSPEKLAINGGSHGGMLVAASMIQRPELFKAVVAEAGPYDMLRLENFTAGGVNTNLKEFGSVTNEIEFQSLSRYSPLQNIKKGVKYPNTLLITGEFDDRVPPLHSYKFLATLQEKGDPKSLYELYVIPGASHSGALTTTDFTEMVLFKYYFIFDQLGVKFW